MLTNLGWSPLADRQNEHRLIMLFKIIHYIVDINADDLLPPRPCIHFTHGHPKRFIFILFIFQEMCGLILRINAHMKHAYKMFYNMIDYGITDW